MISKKLTGAMVPEKAPDARRAKTEKCGTIAGASQG
jgi:hypothetical protein